MSRWQLTPDRRWLSRRGRLPSGEKTLDVLAPCQDVGACPLPFCTRSLPVPTMRIEGTGVVHERYLMMELITRSPIESDREMRVRFVSSWMRTFCASRG